MRHVIIALIVGGLMAAGAAFPKHDDDERRPAPDRELKLSPDWHMVCESGARVAGECWFERSDGDDDDDDDDLR